MTVLLFACLLWTAPPAAADSGLTAAKERLDVARGQVQQLGDALEQTNESYGRVRNHRRQLRGDVAAAERVLAAAHNGVAAAEHELRRRVATVYKHPGADLAITDAVLLAPDAGSAMHRAALYSRLAARGAEDVADAEWAATLTATDTRQGQIIAAGAEGALSGWKARAEDLETALADAQRAVLAAEAGVETAEEEARRRAEAARLASLPGEAGQWGGDGAAPPPRVNGKSCPLGTPNGFIDSWGFPRSGGRTHQGVDMFAPYGTPLYAVADGVIWRVYTNTLGGLSINLIDTEGNMYYYAHLSAASVTSGQEVGAGQVIGAVGDSGNARGTPPHLHWQFHPGNGAPVNPYPLAYALCRG